MGKEIKLKSLYRSLTKIKIIHIKIIASIVDHNQSDTLNYFFHYLIHNI